MLSDVLWPDALLVSLVVDYESVVIRIRESHGGMKTVRCDGYIGYSLCGFWDEVVISQAALHDEHESIDRCTAAIARRLGPDWPASGSAARNARRWRALVVTFSDNADFEVVATHFSVE